MSKPRQGQPAVKNSDRPDRSLEPTMRDEIKVRKPMAGRVGFRLIVQSLEFPCLRSWKQRSFSSLFCALCLWGRNWAIVTAGSGEIAQRSAMLAPIAQGPGKGDSVRVTTVVKFYLRA